MQTNDLLQWQFLPWDVGLVLSELFWHRREYILHHLHSIEKGRTKPHLFLILTSPPLPLLSSGIICGILHVNLQN